MPVALTARGGGAARTRGQLFAKESRALAQVLAAIVLIQFNPESGLVIQLQVAVFNDGAVMLYDLLGNGTLKRDT